MIKLSNGHQFEFAVASGALAFDCRGWPWEWPLRWLGLIDPHQFTIATKTLMPTKWAGNFRKSRPFDVLKFVSLTGDEIHPAIALARADRIGGVANAIGLTGPGIDTWRKRDYPVIERNDYKVIVSITGPEGGQGCVEMARKLNGLKNVVGIEFNASCPNTDPKLLQSPSMVISQCYAIKAATSQPLLLKLSYGQDYSQIAKKVEGLVEAVSINSVPWRFVFGDLTSPLKKYGGGGVSGPVAKPFIWKMVKDLVRQAKVPVIGAGIWEYEDIAALKSLGASAYQFGTIFLPRPWRPNDFARRWQRERRSLLR